MTEARDAGTDVSSLALTPGGCLLHTVARIGGPAAAASVRRWRVVLLPLVTWGPLFVLSAMGGVAWGGRVQIPFIEDFSAHVQFLVALPALFLIEKLVDPWVSLVIQEIATDGILDEEDRPRFAATLGWLQRSRISWGIELVLLGLAYANVFLWHGITPPLPSSWRSLGAWPATWYAAVAIPLYQFFVLRWLWWFCGWCYVLWRLSRLELQLIATHPDQLGGLGVVNLAHARFAVVMVPVSLVAASQIGLRLAFLQRPLLEYKLPIIAVATVALMMTLPLGMLTGKLLAARHKGLVDYSAFASGYARAFGRKWLRGASPGGAEALGSNDIQSLADMQNSFLTVRKMGVVMWNMEVLVPYCLAVAGPMVPLLLTEIPVAKLLRLVLRLNG